MTDQPEIYVVAKPEDFKDAFMKLVKKVQEEVEAEDNESTSVPTPPAQK